MRGPVFWVAWATDAGDASGCMSIAGLGCDAGESPRSAGLYADELGAGCGLENGDESCGSGEGETGAEKSGGDVGSAGFGDKSGVGESAGLNGAA